jgi:hypothetical protein
MYAFMMFLTWRDLLVASGATGVGFLFLLAAGFRPGR